MRYSNIKHEGVTHRLPNALNRKSVREVLLMDGVRILRINEASVTFALSGAATELQVNINIQDRDRDWVLGMLDGWDLHELRGRVKQPRHVERAFSG